MKNARFYSAVCVFILFAACMAHAQATRTWVSGVGNDANPCTRTAPCKTLTEAILKTAAGGVIGVLDPGDFGGVIIDKSITIDGGAQSAGVLVPDYSGILVQAGSNDTVVLRNLDINGGGTGGDGIRFSSGAALIVEHCVISGFWGSGITIVPSSGGQVSIVDTSVQNNSGAGVNIQAMHSNVYVTISKSTLIRNMYGVFAGDFSRVTVRDTLASGNFDTGFIAQAGSGTSIMTLIDSTAANNTVSGVTAGGFNPSTVRASGVSLSSNGAGFRTLSNGTIFTFGNNYNAGVGTPGSTIAPQ